MLIRLHLELIYFKQAERSISGIFQTDDRNALEFTAL